PLIGRLQVIPAHDLERGAAVRAFSGAAEDDAFLLRAHERDDRSRDEKERRQDEVDDREEDTERTHSPENQQPLHRTCRACRSIPALEIDLAGRGFSALSIDSNREWASVEFPFLEFR